MDALERELKEHSRWRLKPEFANFRAYDELLKNEFLAPAEHQIRMARAVQGIVAFATAGTPYYASLFKRLGLTCRHIETPEDLAKLPTLTKHDLLEYSSQMAAPRLPPGEQLYGGTKSSGTTGRPVSVLHTFKSSAMFGLLRQRTARWHGLHPMEARIDVRPRLDLQATREGLQIGDGGYSVASQWNHLGLHFHTGPEYGIAVSTPMERQVELLQQLRPAYATTFPGVFEEWLLANSGQKPVDSLKAIVGIGSQLTPSLRARLEQYYGCPVHMSYGLNEIGKVATRCAAGRYHVNSELCLVQITRGDGSACAPGEVGHILVTGLNNVAQPLIRYDTGDLAEAMDGPCPCGRTLPVFGDIAGRYRSYADLPSGSRERVRAIRNAIERQAPEDLRFLRRYQLHQDLQNRFTLRLRIVSPIPGAFRQEMLRAWEPVMGSPPSPLAITEVDEIAAAPSGKLIDFLSDFHTDWSLALRPGAPAPAPSDA
ncbi:AMP-binding protein [Emcibacter sp. SYSU 3D8]|uniref:phenylacetate--CoA ligase family protein n=1 Tax=Emcibacter sp. SYSU 3D8 TaxID=3133969 RepID=UPI0031FE99C9